MQKSKMKKIKISNSAAQRYYHFGLFSFSIYSYFVYLYLYLYLYIHFSPKLRSHCMCNTVAFFHLMLCSNIYIIKKFISHIEYVTYTN